jgi:hypothetical protein
MSPQILFCIIYCYMCPHTTTIYVSSGAPALSFALYLHNKSDTNTYQNAAPALLATIAPTQTTRIARVRVMILPPILTSQAQLMSTLSGESEGGALWATVRLTNDSQQCHLQRLLSQIQIPIDLSTLTSTSGGSRRGGERGGRGVGVSSSGKGGGGMPWRRETESVVELPDDFGRFLTGTGASAQSPWVVGDDLTDKTMDWDFSFYAFKELDARRAELILKVNNILLFPVHLRTAKYVFDIHSNASYASPAMEVTLQAIDKEVASRNALFMNVVIVFENRSALGLDLLSPALTGLPFRVRAAVDSRNSDATLLCNLVDVVLSHSLNAGFLFRRMTKAPLVMATEALNSLGISAPSPDEIRLLLKYQIDLPGAVILLPIMVC